MIHILKDTWSKFQESFLEETSYMLDFDLIFTKCNSYQLAIETVTFSVKMQISLRNCHIDLHLEETSWILGFNLFFTKCNSYLAIETSHFDLNFRRDLKDT